VIGISVQFLLQSYECTGSGSLHITATRFRQNAPNHIQNSKSFPPDTHRLRALPQTPVPDWKSEKVATLAEANHWRLALRVSGCSRRASRVFSLLLVRTRCVRACVLSAALIVVRCFVHAHLRESMPRTLRGSHCAVGIELTCRQRADGRALCR